MKSYDSLKFAASIERYLNLQSCTIFIQGLVIMMTDRPTDESDFWSHQSQKFWTKHAWGSDFRKFEKNYLARMAPDFSLQAYLCDTYRFRSNFGIEIENFRYFWYCFGIGIVKGPLEVLILVLVSKWSPLWFCYWYWFRNEVPFGFGIGIGTSNLWFRYRSRYRKSSWHSLDFENVSFILISNYSKPKCFLFVWDHLRFFFFIDPGLITQFKDQRASNRPLGGPLGFAG